MGEGLIRAVVATAKRTEHVVLMKQPDVHKIVVRCTICGGERHLRLPSEIPALTAFIKKMEKEHTDCPKLAKPVCPKCGHAFFKHMHNCAHGIPGTHMAGSERYECMECGFGVYASDKIAGFIFNHDPQQA
jgi:predicted RNA-binding Zn-ribbon protein involved in translation (DUF1610 family)